jgi:hypothetical protein
MDTTTTTTTNVAEKPTLATALARIDTLEQVTKELHARIEVLMATVKVLTEKAETKRSANPREMTDDDARNVMSGELKDAKHKDAAEKLGLSYGQIYSCRLGYTFKNIHKEMKTAGTPNPWIK